MGLRMEEQIEAEWSELATVNLEAAIENLGDEEMALEMLSTFEETSLIPNMNKLHLAIFEMDIRVIEFVSHTLKGTAGTMGCDRFTAISLKMNRELKGRTDQLQPDTLTKFYSYLLPEYKSLTKEIHRLKGTEPDCSIPDKFIVEFVEHMQKKEANKVGDAKSQTKLQSEDTANKNGVAKDGTDEPQTKPQSEPKPKPVEKKEPKKVGFADHPAQVHPVERKQNNQEAKCACCVVF